MIIPKQLLPLWKVCPKDESTRYGMRYIRAERDEQGQATLAVTDGRMLVVADLEEPTLMNEVDEPTPRPGFAVSIPVELWRTAFAVADATGGAGKVLILDESEDKISLVSRPAGDLCQCQPDKTVRFPGWREMLKLNAPGNTLDPKEYRGKYVVGSFSPDLLMKLCEVLTGIGFYKLDLHVPVGEAPMFFSAKPNGETGPKITAFLMSLS